MNCRYLPKLAVCLVIVALAACGGGAGGGGGGSTSAPPPPATLSIKYTAPAYFLRGAAITTITPTTSASPTAFLISPALPAGLTLDAGSGAISGTPTGLSAPATYTITATNAAGASTTVTVSLAVQTGNTYQVSVSATPATGSAATLSYIWRSTDGAIQDVNAPQTTWIAPSGPGLHFVYVLISDGAGGYAEDRIVLNTDADGAPPFTPGATVYQAPSSTNTGSPYGYFYVATPVNPSATVSGLTVGGASALSPFVNAAGAVVIATYPASGNVSAQSVPADARGRSYFTGPSLNVNTAPVYTCDLGQGPLPCPNYLLDFSNVPINGITASSPFAYGHVQLSDGTFPGIREPYFGALELPQATLTGCATPPCATVSVNAFGDFALPFKPNAVAAVTVSSQNATASLAIPTDANTNANGVNFQAFPLTASGGSTGAPLISGMTATENGTAVKALVQSVLPVLPSSTTPSSHVPQPDAFLAHIGTDSRLSACLYYQAIGAVLAGGCDKSGNYSSANAINFEDWKRTVQIDNYAPAGAPPTITASYVNVVDLNLTRVHHSINYTTPAPGHVAAYVCNHLGPLDANSQAVTVNLPTPSQAQQPSVDAAVAAANANQLLVACVAMDYMTSPGVNGGAPFTRFLIFGPSGELLPSVNLDGRGEKFVPGTCVACHAGDKYTGSFPTDGSGAADVGAHFLPYDTGNFAFSSVAGLTQKDQEPAIFHLNQNILATNAAVNTVNLVKGWYAAGTTINQNYVPVNWTSTNAGFIADPNLSSSVYLNLVARNCRTCHTALDNYDLDAAPFWVAAAQPNICGSTGTSAGSALLGQAYSMPNALVTFNRFWGAVGASAPNVNLPALLTQWINSQAALVQGPPPGKVPLCTLNPSL
jgi:putative Ig domain-containing protein